jgi:hypothetical protein
MSADWTVAHWCSGCGVLGHSDEDPHFGWAVTRDGEIRSPILDRHSDAFGWILDHQGNSVHHATTFEGWAIVEARRLVLPYSEVCMHLRVAGLSLWGLKVGQHAVQLLVKDLRSLSFPITTGEAGWDRTSRVMYS